MDDVGRARVRLDVLADLGELGRVGLRGRVLLPALVLASAEPDLEVGDHLHDEWEEGVDEHSLDEGVSCQRVPGGDVVGEGAVEGAGGEGEGLGEVGLDQEQDQGSVEELGEEDAVGDLGQHLGVGVVADPGDEPDGQGRQQGVDDDDEAGDSVSDAEGEVGVEAVVSAGRDLPAALIGVCSIRGDAVPRLLVAEALQVAGVGGIFSFGLQRAVGLVVHDSKVHEVVAVVVVVWRAAGRRWVPGIDPSLHLAASEHGGEGEEQSEADDEGSDDLALGSLPGGPASVLPDDVGWFTSFLDVNLLVSKPHLLALHLGESGVLHHVVELSSSLVALFGLEGHEDGAWACAVLEVSVLVVVDLGVDLAHLVELVGPDRGASLLEQADERTVLEGERGGSDLDALGRWVFEAEVRHGAQLLLHLGLEPVAEVGGHRDVRGLAVAVQRDESAVEVGRLSSLGTGLLRLGVSEVELNGEVGSSHCADVPLDEVVLGNLADVVGEDRDVEGDGDGDRRDQQALHLPGGELLFWDDAGDLHEELGAALEALGHDIVWDRVGERVVAAVRLGPWSEAFQAQFGLAVVAAEGAFERAGVNPVLAVVGVIVLLK